MQLVTDYHGMIDWIVTRSGESDKFVHVQVGLAIWSLTALLTGRRQGSTLPLAAVFLAEIGNEIMDAKTILLLQHLALQQKRGGKP